MAETRFSDAFFSNILNFGVHSLLFLFFSFLVKSFQKNWSIGLFFRALFCLSYEPHTMKKKNSLLKSIIMCLMNLMLCLFKEVECLFKYRRKKHPVWWVSQPSFSKCQLLPLHRLTERGKNAFLCHINRASLWMGFLYRVRGIRGDISQAPFNTKLGLNHCDRRPCSNRSFSHV